MTWPVTGQSSSGRTPCLRRRQWTRRRTRLPHNLRMGSSRVLPSFSPPSCSPFSHPGSLDLFGGRQGPSLEGGVLSQFSHPAISNFPLILLLPHSACQPHIPHQFTPLTCAHSCLSSHAISPAYSHQLHTQSFARLFFAMQVFPAFSCLPSRYRPCLSLIPCFVCLLVIRPSLPSLTKNFASPLLSPVCQFLNRLSVCQSLSKALNFLPLSSESFVLQLGPYTTRYKAQCGEIAFANMSPFK